MELDLVLVHFFQFHILIGVKMLLLLELIWAHLCILIIRKDVLILGKGSTQGLDNTTLTTEAEYSIDFSRSQRKFCLSLHYNGSNNFYLLMPQKYINSKQKILK